MAGQVVEVVAGRRDVDEAEQGGAQLLVLRRHLHRLDVQRLERVARRARKRRVDRAPDSLQLSLHRANHMLPPVPDLVIGPLLRYVGETEAIVWVETDSPCEVEVLGTRDRTFQGRRATTTPSSAAPASTGAPGTSTRSASTASASGRWRGSRRASSTPIRRRSRSRSCSAPAAWRRRTSRPTRCARTRTSAAARSTRSTRSPSACCDEPRERWPDVLLMIGDQVYADEVSPATRAFIESRRDASGEPGCVVVDLRGVHAALPRELDRPTRSAGCSRRCRR